MRKEELDILDEIEQLQKNQLYLMEHPVTPQQKFLHLFAHHHLLQHKMIHKNLDHCLGLLPGSFANNSLLLSYSALCLQNHIEVPEAGAPLLALVNSWVAYYPSLRGRKKVLLGEVVLQESLGAEEVQGFDLYLAYLNLISFDLWKLLRGSESEEEFLGERPLKEELEGWRLLNLRHVDASDLLTFVSSCVPKTLLNIVLERASLPPQMRASFGKLECLYANEAVEYYLRASRKLSLLLKGIFLLLLQLELSGAQLKFLMLVAMRFYYVFHYDRRLGAAEVLIYAYNKLTDDIRRSLIDEFSLFLKVVLKLGKHKFASFLAQNSPFLGAIVEAVRKKPLIGYPQESASPYNTIGIGETLQVERGSRAVRYFEVLEEFSIFYYRIEVLHLDLTLRLHYLGEVGARREGQTLLFSQEKKAGTVKNCINAMKKGLYMFEFDNSYSWINSKILRYENVVYAPLEIKSDRPDDWLPDFYHNLFQNEVHDPKDIHLVALLPPTPPSPQPTALLSRGKGTFTLATTTPDRNSYQYETDSASRMEQRLSSLLLAHPQLQVAIDGQRVEFEAVRDFLRERSSEKGPLERIEYYEEEEGSLEEGEEASEQVEPKELERSQIIKEGVEEGEGAGSTREEISCSLGETDNFYREQG